MVLMRGFWNGNMYKIFRRTIINGWKNYVVSEGGDEEDQTPMISREKEMKWHQILGRIRQKGFQ
jgi:hypothetical protein